MVPLSVPGVASRSNRCSRSTPSRSTSTDLEWISSWTWSETRADCASLITAEAELHNTVSNATPPARAIRNRTLPKASVPAVTTPPVTESTISFIR